MTGTYYVLSTEFGRKGICLTKFEAESDEEAWESLEDMGTNLSQDWLLSEEQVRDLKDQCQVALGEKELEAKK